MGQASKPAGLENKHEQGTAQTDAVVRDPSYPDRARIDSDVRAFLRPASSPWIVFDRDSRVDDFAKSALRVGAVFASSPNLREDVKSSADAHVVAPLDTPVQLLGPMNVAMNEKPDAFAPGAFLAPSMSSIVPGGNMFPAETGPADPILEPSSLVVASDVNSESAVALDHARPTARETISSDPFAAGIVPNRRAFWIAGACAAVLAIVGVTSIAVAGPSRTSRAPAKSVTTQVAVAAKVEAKPEKVEVPAPVEPAVVAPAEPSATTTTTTTTESDTAGKMSNDPKKRFGRLTIKADGKTKNVWFDGKRMLGTGTRSFMVFCGMHTVAVNDKSEAKDIEVPCNGEFVAQAK